MRAEPEGRKRDFPAHVCATVARPEAGVGVGPRGSMGDGSGRSVDQKHLEC